MKNYILGINSVYHESSVCLVGDGKLLAYAEEERFNRVKHGKFSCPENTDLLPVHSLNYCLQVAGLTGAEITKVGFSFVPDKRLPNLTVETRPVAGTGYGTEVGERLVQTKLQDTPHQIRELLQNPTVEFEWLDHHLCHAVSAFAVSPYAEAALLVIDGIAEFDTIYLGYGTPTGIRPLKRISYPHSLGFLWEKMSRFLGYTKYDAGKIMGLSAYGNADRFYPHFRQFVDFSLGNLTIDNQILAIRSEDFSGLEQVFGLTRRTVADQLLLSHADLAAGLQKITEEVVLDLANYLYQQIDPPTSNLCFAGGVALNCQANAVLARQGPFENLFIPPHCHDAGTSIGAAFYLASPEFAKNPSAPPFSPFWATGNSEEEILRALQSTALKYVRRPDIHQATAELLAAGEIVAYCQGPAEIGPRALGNRSILAAPDIFMVKEVLNFKVKHREFFRPLAPVVLREYLTEYFELPFKFSPALYYMLLTLKVKPEKQHLLPGVTHIDGTARVQVVDEVINPNLYRLLKAYYDRTGLPILLNTSFNHQEPIVHTAADAVRTFTQLPTLNYLVLNDFLVSKT